MSFSNYTLSLQSLSPKFSASHMRSDSGQAAIRRVAQRLIENAKDNPITVSDIAEAASARTDQVRQALKPDQNFILGEPVYSSEKGRPSKQVLLVSA